MSGERKSYSSLEEEIYWSQFRVVQFLQRVSDNSNDALVLPTTFVKNLREKLAGSVVLKTPNGGEYVVELATSGECVVLFKGKWKEFAEAHCLQKDDTLIFKYHGNSEFDVTMFDGRTGCEKVRTYFVRKEADVVVEMPPHTAKESKCEDDCVLISPHDNKNSATTSGSVGGRTTRKRSGRSSACEDDMDFISLRKGKNVVRAMRGSVSGSIARKQLATKLFEDITEQLNRRVVTDIEKQRTLERAFEELNDNGLLIPMRASYVYARFFLVFSVKWARSQGLKGKQELELRMDDKSWYVKFYDRETSVGLTRGWKAFVLDNGLEEDDVCLFNIVPGSQHPVAINVRVFRVADDVNGSPKNNESCNTNLV
ncbi:putative B3 domain-containing protein [Sesamum alatum]|uniref:B3 domain-containing protein n=1 Tax=Sesamum alatum TaxID=300844 RepID=A0AAE1YW90_9LAMI|nr:putative B3 domain-containing protein [Sesamum alatum]